MKDYFKCIWLIIFICIDAKGTAWTLGQKTSHWTQNLGLRLEYRNATVHMLRMSIKFMSIKAYNFYTLNTVIFQTVPQSITKNVQELIQEFLLSWDIRFECIFWVPSVIRWGQFASSFTLHKAENKNQEISK